MDHLKLDAESITEMKSFYQEELAKTLHRLEHINQVLSQLGSEVAQVEMSFSAGVGSVKKVKTSIPKRKYKKKRGPKSKWDKAIIKTITSAGRPLTYDEITNFLMISEGRDPSKRKNTKATVQNTVFRLRHDKKLSTFSMGSRTKYIAPSSWVDKSSGAIAEEYKAKIVLPKKIVVDPKKPKRGPGRPRKTERALKTSSPKVSPTKSKAALKAKATGSKPPVKSKAASKAKKAASPKKEATPAPIKAKPAAKKAPVKKAAAKKPAAKKAPVKKAAAKKAAAKKAPVKKAAAKKPAAKKALVEKAAAKKAAAKKAPVKKAAAKKPAAKKAPAKVVSAKKATLENATVEKASVEKASVEKASASKKKASPKTKKAASTKASAAKSAVVKAPKETESKAPRKIAMTKTVKTKRKKS
jgi:hypothetical protein